MKYQYYVHSTGIIKKGPVGNKRGAKQKERAAWGNLFTSQKAAVEGHQRMIEALADKTPHRRGRLWPFVVGLFLGALLLYGLLWYQVYHKLDAVWCQVYTGGITIERAEHCERLAK